MPPARTNSAPADLLASADALVDVAAAACVQREAELRLEQAVRGLDALDELEFHPLLASAFLAAGLGVVREAVYPAEVAAARPRRSERQRCDLVLLPAPGTLLDPVAERLERDDLAASLFAPVASRLPPATGTRPEDAYWLEVKTVGQFTFTDGWSGPNRSYSSDMARTLTDLDKLGCDPHIHRAGLILILFSRDQATADHDLDALYDQAIANAAPTLHPSRARLPILDRIGNGLCTLCLFPVRCGH